MTDKETVQETAQPEPSKKVKIAKAATQVAANVVATIIVGVVTEMVTDRINKRYFPDNS